MKKKILCLAVAALVLSACGSSSKNLEMQSIAADNYTNAAMDSSEQGYAINEEMYEAEWEADDGTFAEAGSSTSAPSAPVQDTNRKLIKTVNLTVETQEFDKLLQIVENKTAEYGGYVEQLYTYNGSVYSSYRSNKNASLTLRIPKDKLDDFLSEVGQVSNITSRNESVEDVTLTYVDMESHKEVLLTEEERLLSFLEQATTIEEIITIESRLSDVRYQIESMESQLRTYDNKIDYSTVYLDINEVAVLTPPAEEETVGQRIANGFMNSVESILNGLQEIVIGFLIVSPYLIFAVLLVLIIVGIVVGSVKFSQRKKKTKSKKAPVENGTVQK